MIAIPSVTKLTACGLGSCWHASQAFAYASTLHSANCDATRHVLSGVRCGQWIIQPPPLPRRHSSVRPRVVLDFHNLNQATPNRMTRSMYWCNRRWNFLAVVRLVGEPIAFAATNVFRAKSGSPDQGMVVKPR